MRSRRVRRASRRQSSSPSGSSSPGGQQARFTPQTPKAAPYGAAFGVCGGRDRRKQATQKRGHTPFAACSTRPALVDWDYEVLLPLEPALAALAGAGHRLLLPAQAEAAGGGDQLRPALEPPGQGRPGKRAVPEAEEEP